MIRITAAMDHLYVFEREGCAGRRSRPEWGNARRGPLATGSGVVSIHKSRERAC